MTKSKLTPPEIARRYGCSPEKVLTWIKTGELAAMNAATLPGGKPRYLIDVAALRAFEAARTVVPPPQPTRCRRRDPEVIEYF